jgi:hypothetical protein
MVNGVYTVFSGGRDCILRPMKIENQPCLDVARIALRKTTLPFEESIANCSFCILQFAMVWSSC